MKILILGSGSGIADPSRNASSYLLKTDTVNLLIDAGDGTARQLARFQIDPLQIDGVIITHTHSDHAAGLFMLMQYMHVRKRVAHLPVYVPQGLLPGFASVFPYFQIYKGHYGFEFDLYPVKNGLFYSSGQIDIIGIANSHLEDNVTLARKEGIDADSYSLDISIHKKSRILYTSDIQNLKHLEALSHLFRLMICECTHVDLETASDYAMSHRIPNLILTHIPPHLDVTDKPFFLSEADGISIEFAEDGKWIEI